MAFFELGSRVWVKVNTLWTPAVASGSDGVSAQFTDDYGQVHVLKTEELGPETVTNMHQSSIDGVDDMANLVDLHDGAILYNIGLRVKASKIYTYIGSILSAVNPYKELPGVYETAVISKYNKKPLGELPPHIYAIANEAYYAMWKVGQSQVVLISGESGAGKTESTKFIMRYLSYVSNELHQADKNKKSFEQLILQANPILEAFGNAKTIYNNNSSRFGKFVKINFSSGGFIESGKIIDYLLEKNRVVRLNPNERTFHIFYSLLVGGHPELGSMARDPQAYGYLKQSGVWTDPTINDKADWERILKAFEVMQFSKQNQADIIKVLVCILLLGNVKFAQAGGAQIADQAAVKAVASVLGVDPAGLAEVLITVTREVRGESISTPLEIHEAVDSRDSLSMALYSRLFKWIIAKLNVSLKGAETFHSVGVLDIFGFENFEVNSFEQFNINYANEKLQQYFNRHIFSLEQLEYNREGISWSEIDWVDNGECLDLIERKLGVLSLIDEEARFPKGTDESLLAKLHSSNAQSAFYVKPRVVVAKFGIRHYAGDVMYDVAGFLEKNRDTFRDDLLNLVQSSSNDFVYDLFEHAEGSKASSTSTSRKKPTVSYQFKESLTSLMHTLGQANPYFVRCLKPNIKKVPDVFDSTLVLNQLRYSGMLETVRIRRSGYPVRRVFDDFLFRYRVLFQGLSKAGGPKEQCGILLAKYDGTKKDWQLGSTKVFLREKLENVLEKTRHEQLRKTVMKIQAMILGYAARKRYQHTRKAIIRIQAWVKMFLYVRRYLKKRNAAIKIQSVYRGYKARLLRAKLAEQKRIEEERRREEERKREQARLAEIARLEAAARETAAREEAERQLAELKRKQEEEARQKAEEEARKKAEDDRKMKEALERAKQLDEARHKAEEEARKKAEEAQRLIEEAKRMKEIEEARRKEEIKAQAEAELARKQMEVEAKQEQQEAMLEEEENAASFLDEAPDEFKEGYLAVFAGVFKNLKKRWCVLNEGTFMWFRSKQDNLKAGYMTKMGGGTSTLGRKNWKRRWFSLKGGELFYSPTDEEGSEVLGVVDVQHCTNVTKDEVPFDKENCFAIITPKRTYYMYTDTPEEREEWIIALNNVRGKSDEEIKAMLETAKVDPRNAEGTLDVDDILSVGTGNKTDNEGHPMFVILCADRVYKFIAADQADMDDWIRILTPKKRSASMIAEGDDVIERGWLMKEGGKGAGFKRRRWFVLRGDVISYYKTKGDEFTVGSIPLNSLSSVIPPDEASSVQRNEWTFTVHSRRKSYQLGAKTQADCYRWVNAIQDVIDNSPLIETPTEKLIEELKMASPAEVESIYAAHKVLTFSNDPLRASLLPLPYGETAEVSGRKYGTLQEEAVKVSVSLLPISDSTRSLPRYGAPAEPIPLIKNIIQACFDMPKLRNEVYCQVIKQTTNSPQPGSPLNMMHWHLLASLCCSFMPSRKFLRFLRFHLRRTLEFQDHLGEDVGKMATFCLEALKTTKARDFPPSSEEIKGIMTGRGLVCTVHCVGGRSIEIPITSSTTCGEVIQIVKQDLNLMNCRNGFGLFESCGAVEKYLEEKYSISDILSKWEKYAAHGINPDGGDWELVFKLFCFFDPVNPKLSITEQEFIFEQAFESVMDRHYPADPDTHVKLAALRTQYVVGDYEDGAYISDLVKVHPAQQEQLLSETSGALGTLKKAGTILKGTLKGFGKNTLKRLTGGSVKKELSVSDAELAKIKEKICLEWKKLKGMSKNDSRLAYMKMIQAWEGYGANLFDVEQGTHKQWPKELWLAISLNGVGIYARGEAKQLAFYKYESVLSFGAPVANKYKIMIDNVGSILFETNMVLEIAKLMKEYIREIVARRR